MIELCVFLKFGDKGAQDNLARLSGCIISYFSGFHKIILPVHPGYSDNLTQRATLSHDYRHTHTHTHSRTHTHMHARQTYKHAHTHTHTHTHTLIVILYSLSLLGASYKLAGWKFLVSFGGKRLSKNWDGGKTCIKQLI